MDYRNLLKNASVTAAVEYHNSKGCKSLAEKAHSDTNYGLTAEEIARREAKKARLRKQAELRRIAEQVMMEQMFHSYLLKLGYRLIVAQCFDESLIDWTKTNDFCSKEVILYDTLRGVFTGYESKGLFVPGFWYRIHELRAELGYEPIPMSLPVTE